MWVKKNVSLPKVLPQNVHICMLIIVIPKVKDEGNQVKFYSVRISNLERLLHTNALLLQMIIVFISRVSLKFKNNFGCCLCMRSVRNDYYNSIKTYLYFLGFS